MVAFWQRIRQKRQAWEEIKKEKRIQEYIEQREELLFQLELNIGSSKKAEKEGTILEEIREVTSRLEKLQVHVIKGQKLELFNQEKHEVIAKQEVDAVEYNNRVLEIYGDGYEYQGKIIRKMHVMIGRLK